MHPITPAEPPATVSAADVAAWIALGLAVISIIAQFVARYLDGGRLSVKLNLVLREEFGSIYTRTSGQWPFGSSQLDGRAHMDPSSYMELAEIVVENKGRHPITVHNIGFAWKGDRQKGKLRRTRHHVVPRVFKIDGHGERTYIDVSDFRLEAADRMSMLFDYLLLLKPDRKSPGGVMKLRASANTAGRPRATLSSRRKQWVIPDSAVSGFRDQTLIPARGIIARQMARVANGELGAPRILMSGYVARRLESHIGGIWPSDYKARHDLLMAFFKHDEEWAAVEKTMDDKGSILSLVMMIERELTDYRDRINWQDIFIKP